MSATQPPLHDSQGQAAWTLDNGEISLTVTRLGGQMAPVLFRRAGREVQPYFISPWQGEGYHDDCKLLEPLRGDFFCLPFGANTTSFRGEEHPPHGETSDLAWDCTGIRIGDVTSTMALSMETKVREGRVERCLSLVRGHPAIYSECTVTGFTGPASFGQHPILALPEETGALKISTSPILFGMTVPHVFEPAEILAKAAIFNTLAEVPLAGLAGKTVDLSSLPISRSHSDLLMVMDDATANPAWVCAVNTVEHWLWFAFKDPLLMPARVFWIEAHGRQQAPWLGRTDCIGIEDGCMYFDAGLAESAAPNVLSERGVATFLDFPGTPVAIRHIQGAVPVAPDFGRVSNVVFGENEVTFTDHAGAQLTIPLKHSFLFDGKLPCRGSMLEIRD